MGDTNTFLEIGWKYGYQKKLMQDRAHSLMYGMISIKELNELDEDELVFKGQAHVRFIKDRYSDAKAVPIEIHTVTKRFRRRLDKIVAVLPKESFREWFLYHIALKRQEKNKDLKFKEDEKTEPSDDDAPNVE